MNGFVYIQSEPGIYTTGHYSPDGKWHADEDFNDKSEAVARCHELNGGTKASAANDALETIRLRDRFAMAAMEGMAAKFGVPWYEDGDNTTDAKRAKGALCRARICYTMADAMMKARTEVLSDAE